MVRDWGHGPRHRAAHSLSPLSHHIAWVGVAQWLLAGCTLHHQRSARWRSRLDWIIETGHLRAGRAHACHGRARRAAAAGHRATWRVEVFYMAGAPIPPSVAQAFVAAGRQAAEHLRHDRELVAPVHPPKRRQRRSSSTTCGRGGSGIRGASVRPGGSMIDAVPTGRCGPDRRTRRRADAGLLRQSGRRPRRASTATAGSCPAIWACWTSAAIFKIVGRLKDLIIRGGHNIYPRAHRGAGAAARQRRAGRPAFQWRTSGSASGCASP